jgi:hypothetical protein
MMMAKALKTYRVAWGPSQSETCGAEEVFATSDTAARAEMRRRLTARYFAGHGMKVLYCNEVLPLRPQKPENRLA